MTTALKHCPRCDQSKPLTDYPKNKRTKDGLACYCRVCHNHYTLTDYYRRHESALAARKAYKKRNRDKVRAANRRYNQTVRKLYPEREAARSAVSNAIRDGRLIPQPCRVCGKKAEAHHPDYSKPLEIDWLCLQHHKDEHRRLREQRRVAA